MILDSSSTTTQVELDGTVASGDTQYTRRQLRLVNKLHDIG